MYSNLVGSASQVDASIWGGLGFASVVVTLNSLRMPKTVMRRRKSWTNRLRFSGWPSNLSSSGAWTALECLVRLVSVILPVNMVV